MSNGDFYFAYADDVETIDGPYDTPDDAIAAAKERYVEDDGEDETDMLILRVTKRLTVTSLVQVNVQEAE